jgi:phospholipid/cholesterol/gamma-HCH transport system ATP-binding protein
MGTNCLISVENVWTRYGSTIVHRDLNLCVEQGKVLAIIGGSGSGKTTLLRLLLGLEMPSQGQIKVFDRPLQGCSDDDLREIRRRWGVLFQEGALFSALSVYDNVALPLRELNALPEEVICELVMMKLSMVQIDAASAGKMPAELSGGMVKRVGLARALALNPELLFLDEPTAGLDPERSHGFVQLIESLRRALKLTVVMVSHDVDTVMALADRVAVLAEQRLLTVAPLWEVVHYDHPFVKSFFLGRRCEKENVKDFRRKLAITPQEAVDGGY